MFFIRLVGDGDGAVGIATHAFGIAMGSPHIEGDDCCGAEEDECPGFVGH